MSSFDLNVNGNFYAVEADGQIPLLWVLRDLLGLTGTKFSCGEGLCGSCTVLVDGAATRSCIQLVGRAAALLTRRRATQCSTEFGTSLAGCGRLSSTSYKPSAMGAAR